MGIDRYRQLSLPTTLIQGDRSPAHLHERVSDLATTLPNAHVITLPGQGHTAHRDAPGVLARVIGEAAGAVSGDRACVMWWADCSEHGELATRAWNDGGEAGPRSIDAPPSHICQSFVSPSFTTLIRSVAALKSIVSRFFVIANAIPVSVSPYA